MRWKFNFRLGQPKGLGEHTNEQVCETGQAGLAAAVQRDTVTEVACCCVDNARTGPPGTQYTAR